MRGDPTRRRMAIVSAIRELQSLGYEAPPRANQPPFCRRPGRFCQGILSLGTRAPIPLRLWYVHGPPHGGYAMHVTWTRVLIARPPWRRTHPVSDSRQQLAQLIVTHALNMVGREGGDAQPFTPRFSLALLHLVGTSQVLHWPEPQPVF